MAQSFDTQKGDGMPDISYYDEKLLDTALNRASAEGQTEPAAVYLLSLTPKGRAASPEDKSRSQRRITDAVRAAGGSCRLFQLQGESFDFVSIITGISDDKVLQDISVIIESAGNVTARLMRGVHLMKGGP